MLKIGNNKIKRKFQKNSVLFTIILASLVLISYNVINNWHKKTIAKNSVLCNATARKLLMISKENIENFGRKSYFSMAELSPTQQEEMDITLTKITEEILAENIGLEGGFYFNGIDKFLGYAYPTSSPPIPVYGPPPRSYNIIREQCLKSITQNSYLLELHGFDPAVFPLMTIPVKFQNKIVGTIWVRIHIERELPLIKLQNVVNIAAVILIISLLFVLWFTYQLRENIQSIRDELEKIHLNPNYRIQNREKLFREIVSSINLTLEKLESGNHQRRSLERKLLQREKMASIGRIVAGVAHEVRTPLAIIKTRIQIWQQLLKEQKLSGNKQELITEDAMELVVNETNRLSNLIKRLLIFSKPINKTMFNINLLDQIRETINILQIQKENSNIEFIINNNDDPFIEADANSIQQVFINILANSMEAMPRGGKITINIKSVANDRLMIEFIDTGEGIPEHIFDRMFELFVTSKSSGVGLGLPISYEIIKAHNGEIFFENLDQGGVKCTILFPIKQQLV